MGDFTTYSQPVPEAPQASKQDWHEAEACRRLESFVNKMQKII